MIVVVVHQQLPQNTRQPVEIKKRSGHLNQNICYISIENLSPQEDVVCVTLFAKGSRTKKSCK